jgi:hypothetical protein
MKMKPATRFAGPVIILGALLLALPVTILADKPDAVAKGGKPNKNSVATTAACTIDDDTARVCSCKGLSNVVLWCGTTWVKHESFGSDSDRGEVFDAMVDCVDAEGESIPGPITMVGIKSGSQKNAKHHPEGYQTVEGAPSGSGLFVTPLACSDQFVCPAAGDCKQDEQPPGDDSSDDSSDDDDSPVLY